MTKPDHQSSASGNWMLITNCLARANVSSPANLIAVAATVAVETAHTFLPIREMANKDYLMVHYWDDRKVRNELGNMVPLDAVSYCGRGYIQLTGRNNYQKAGSALGIPLLANPDRALVPAYAARVLAYFWCSHGLAKLCDLIQKDWDDPTVDDAVLQSFWLEVRRKVNGGLNGLTEFIDALKICGVTYA